MRHRVELLLLDEFAEARNTYESESYQKIRESVLTDYAAAIQSIIDISKNFGIEPILMTQPNCFTLEDDFTKGQYNRFKQAISYEDYCDLYLSLNNVTRRLAEENTLLLIDLDLKVEKNSANFYDTIYLSTRGNQLVSDLIVEAVERKYPVIFFGKM